MRKSPCTFPGIGATSPLLFLARRYAILDGPGFPNVAEGDEEPNDTYVQQLTECAAAAVGEVRFGFSVAWLLLQAGYWVGGRPAGQAVLRVVGGQATC